MSTCCMWDLTNRSRRKKSCGGMSGKHSLQRRGDIFWHSSLFIVRAIWPSRKQLVTYTLVVLVFVSFMVALVALLDFLVGQGVNALFGA